VRNADYKSTEGLAKSERSEDFGADRVLEHVGSPPGVGDEISTLALSMIDNHLELLGLAVPYQCQPLKY
jgi:hypothetical protein